MKINTIIEELKLINKKLSTNQYKFLGQIVGGNNDTEISNYTELINKINSSEILEDEDKTILSNYFYKFSEVIIEDKEHTKKEELNLNISKQKELENFTLKNILFKGVPGTGKSHKIDKIINDETKLNLSDKPENILRVNIHSASSNADLMQGIAITTENEQVSYQEKQGLIFKHIQKACFSPYEPFVLVLEEIQENSLNELIGDLIYLIEDNKRAKIQDIIEKTFKDNDYVDNEKYEYEKLIGFYLKNIKNPHSVEIPNLVSIDDENRKMIMPDNLYIFCTSNYRDDKKVIEDNLLRRFDVIEVYPQYKDIIAEEFKSQEVSDFLEALNDKILSTFESQEIHPDRFLIGHSNWLNIKEMHSTEFYKAVLKVVIEFKEIREIEFSQGIKKIFRDDNFKSEDNIDLTNYKALVESLQKVVYKDIF